MKDSPLGPLFVRQGCHVCMSFFRVGSCRNLGAQPLHAHVWYCLPWLFCDMRTKQTSKHAVRAICGSEGHVARCKPKASGHSAVQGACHRRYSMIYIYSYFICNAFWSSASLTGFCESLKIPACHRKQSNGQILPICSDFCPNITWSAHDSPEGWKRFLAILRFDERLEFNEGDIGLAGTHPTVVTIGTAVEIETASPKDSKSKCQCRGNRFWILVKKLGPNSENNSSSSRSFIFFVSKMHTVSYSRLPLVGVARPE